ncbi:hypothetical protein INR77_08960 [Erythrobacter sp. SCSIO 43205]|uniref:hypothetical protein n=1 Tax=Erythrobacter sp. SCSIO 43205 TaxID=2779361 RepID=UPI001CA9B442|nr:hypothetical protein [Erythrobacter sp. SCSIO 43205]UAB76976.1 hypothetical protein INR77_08960 [Erythrobacter sp. SCSIO 43205]
MSAQGEIANTAEQFGLLYFDTGGRFWTPAWDFERGAPKACMGYVRPNGSRYVFGHGMVTAAEAREAQIADCGPYFGGTP